MKRILKDEVFDISEKSMKRMEESFWRGIRIRYWLRKYKQLHINHDADDYDIEMLLNTCMILKSEIEQLKKKIEILERKRDR